MCSRMTYRHYTWTLNYSSAVIIMIYNNYYITELNLILFNCSEFLSKLICSATHMAYTIHLFKLYIRSRKYKTYRCFYRECLVRIPKLQLSFLI